MESRRCGIPPPGNGTVSRVRSRQQPVPSKGEFSHRIYLSFLPGISQHCRAEFSASSFFAIHFGSASQPDHDRLRRQICGAIRPPGSPGANPLSWKAADGAARALFGPAINPCGRRTSREQGPRDETPDDPAQPAGPADGPCPLVRSGVGGLAAGGTTCSGAAPHAAAALAHPPGRLSASWRISAIPGNRRVPPAAVRPSVRAGGFLAAPRLKCSCSAAAADARVDRFQGPGRVPEAGNGSAMHGVRSYARSASWRFSLACEGGVS